MANPQHHPIAFAFKAAEIKRLVKALIDGARKSGLDIRAIEISASGDIRVLDKSALSIHEDGLDQLL